MAMGDTMTRHNYGDVRHDDSDGRPRGSTMTGGTTTATGGMTKATGDMTTAMGSRVTGGRTTTMGGTTTRHEGGKGWHDKGNDTALFHLKKSWCQEFVCARALFTYCKYVLFVSIILKVPTEFSFGMVSLWYLPTRAGHLLRTT
jgi:hypothetical protein